MTAAELAASRAEAERLRKRVASLSEENASLQEAVQLVAAAQKEVTVRRSGWASFAPRALCPSAHGLLSRRPRPCRLRPDRATRRRAA